MFDPAILQALERTLPPQPPPPAIVQNWVSPAGAVAHRVGKAVVDDYARRADAYVAEIEQLWPILEKADFPKATTTELTQLEERIADLELHAELRAIDSARLEKRMRRDIKSLFQRDPSIGAAARDTADKMIASDKRVVECLLNMALVLRVIVANESGHARGGPVFNDVDALAKHLDGLVA